MSNNMEKEMSRIKKDIQRLKELNNKHEYNYSYEENQPKVPYNPRPISVSNDLNSQTKYPNTNTNTIYSINNNPIIYQKIVNTSYNGNSPPINSNNQTNQQQVPWSLLYELQKKQLKYSPNSTMNKPYRTTEVKTPFKKGIFSYKKQIDNLSDNPNHENNAVKSLTSLARQGANTSILSQELKMNFSEEEDDSMQDSRNPNNSSWNWNKYKISTSNSMNSSNIMPKNILLNEAWEKKPKTMMSQSGKISSANTNNNNNHLLSNYKLSSDQIISPQTPEVLSPIPKHYLNHQQSNPQTHSQVTSIPVTVIKENFEFYKNKPQYEKESRRMMIDYLKLMKTEANPSKPIETVLQENKISNKILQQEQVITYKKVQNQSTNHFSSSLLYTLLHNANISNSTNHQNSSSPALNRLINPLQHFLSDINDDSKGKVDLINFLCVSRVMNIISKVNNSFTSLYIFWLSPNIESYMNGYETYSFKWSKLDDASYCSCVDVLKITSCRSNGTGNQFEIEWLNDYDEREKIIVEASTKELHDNYVKCLNYLMKLVKCKVYASGDNRNSYNNRNGYEMNGRRGN